MHKNKKLAKTVKAFLPMLALLGGPAVASTRHISSSVNGRKLKSLAAVYVDKQPRSDTNNRLANKQKNNKRAVFGAFSNKNTKTQLNVDINSDTATLAFLQDNGWLKSGKEVVSKISGNTLKSSDKIFSSIQTYDHCDHLNGNLQTINYQHIDSCSTTSNYWHDGVPVADSTPPTISAVSIADNAHKVGDTVSATITVASDSDDYTTGSGAVSGSINGYALGSLTKINDSTYTATFTITDAGTDVSAGDDVAVSFTLTDSAGNSSSSYSTAISQANDAIYANLPTLNLTTDSNTIAEAGGISTLSATLTDSLNNQWPEDITVNLAYTGTASTADYSKSDSIVVATGNSSNTATVTAIADNLFDAAIDETAIVNISSVSVGNEGSTNQQTITISDAQSAPTLTLSVGSNPVAENGGTSTITATLSTITYEDTVVTLSYAGSATGAGSDYNTPSSSITIAAGTISANAVTGITAVNDSDADGEQTIIIDVASVSGGSASENATQQQTVTILDDDDGTPPTISAVSIANSAHKVGDSVSATITADSDSDDYTTGSGAISGTINGYTLGSLTKVNDSTYTATFTIADSGTDVSASDDVVVSFTLTDSTGNISAMYTTAISQSSDAIFANLPTINLTTNTNTIAEESGVATLTTTLANSLNNQWPEDISVNLAYTGTATAGSDYSKSDTIVISAGSSSNTNTVTAIADSVFDTAIDETVIVDITTVSVGSEGSTNQQTITISDAQTTPIVTLSVGSNNIAENGGTTTITATLNNATYADVIVNLDYSGTATNGGTDYNNPSSSITITAGNLTENAITGITAVDDNDVDDAQTVIIAVTSVSGGSAIENSTQQQTVTILDDDGPIGPVIIVPDDITLNATGLYSKVATGTATATNQAGAPIAVSLVDNNLLLSPGKHELVWQATDALGVRSVASQQVIVHPLISLSKDQVIYEGNDVEVQVILNGPAPDYPMIIAYTITGTADNSDHDAIDGNITITEGQIGFIRFNTLPDTTIEADESVIVTLASGLNLGKKSATKVIISENNIAPTLSFQIEQNSQQRQIISKEDGNVTITATLTDPNPDDTVMLNWESDTLVDIENDQNIFIFSPASYPVGHHSITVTATDNGQPNLSVTKHLFINIKQTLAALSATQDSDADGIPDSTEGYGDDDGDGIPNYQDSNNIKTCNVVPETLNTQKQFLVEGEPGVCLRKGSASLNSEQGGLQIAEDQLAATDSEAKNVGGLFDFIAYGLPQAGQVYSIVFPQLVPIPSSAVYRKYSNNEWVDYVVDTNNKLLSSAGEQGYCPPPGDANWVMGLQENHWCVQLQIQDGGPNDDDGIANSTIIDPGGVSVLRAGNTMPIAEDDHVSLLQNTEITIAVLDNDSDADDDVLAVVNASVNFGTVIINNQKTITYTPSTDYIGLDTVTYTINDNNGGTAVAQVHITVKSGTVTNTSGGGSMSWLFSVGVLLLAVRRKYGQRLLMVLLTMLSFNSRASDDITPVKEVTSTELTEHSAITLDRTDTYKWTIAVNTGISRLHGDSNVSGIPAENIIDIDDQGISWGVTLNYRVTHKWGLSLGYLDLGETQTVLQGNTPNYHQSVAQVTPIFANGVLLGLNYQFWQYNKFSSTVMIGAFSWRSQIDSSIDNVTLEHKQRGVDLYAGLGFSYALTKDWQLGLEVTRYFLDVNDVDDFSLKLAYRFN